MNGNRPFGKPVWCLLSHHNLCAFLSAAETRSGSLGRDIAAIRKLHYFRGDGSTGIT